MLRLLISILSILAAQALDFQNILKASRWTLKAAHHGISKHVDVSWEDLKQIQDRYKAHRPMQIRNTDKQWSVDHAFKFLLKHGQRFEGASIKAQSKGFDFEGTLHGTQYKLQCAHRCRVHRLGDYRDNSLAYDTHEDDMTHDEWLLHRESDKKLNLLAGESINPSADSTLNCLRVIATQDCEAHGFAPLHNKQLCVEAMNDAVPEARQGGINIPVISTASTMEGATSPDCSTNGHVIIYNERAENVYVVPDGTVQTGMGTLTNYKRVSSNTPGAEEAPYDAGCSKHEPCICQYMKNHTKAGHTGERVLCDDVHDDYINRTALRHPHVNMLACHPAESIVRVQHPCDAGMCVSPRRMDELKIGDFAESSKGVFEPIIGFSHMSYTRKGHYLQLHTNKTTLNLSPNHMLYVNGKRMRAGQANIFDTVNNGERIEEITFAVMDGIFHPATLSTKLIVDNVQTSTMVSSKLTNVFLTEYVLNPLMYGGYIIGEPVIYTDEKYDRKEIIKNAYINVCDYVQNYGLLGSLTANMLWIPSIMMIYLTGFPSACFKLIFSLFLIFKSYSQKK